MVGRRAVLAQQSAMLLLPGCGWRPGDIRGSRSGSGAEVQVVGRSGFVSPPSCGTSKGRFVSISPARTSSSSREASAGRSSASTRKRTGRSSSRCSSTSAAACGSGSKAVDAQQAARHLFSALKTGDEAALFAFDTRLRRSTASRRTSRGLESAMSKVEAPFGQTSLYDAIAETARGRCAEASAGTARLAAASGHRRADRRHRHEEPADGAEVSGDREQHRRAGLRRRGDVANRRSRGIGVRQPAA